MPDISVGAETRDEDRRRVISPSLSAILPAVHDELRRIARNAMCKEAASHTLQATAVVNEACLRLRDQRNLDVGNRSQFFALAATMIRRVLVDHAWARQAEKRGSDFARVTLSGVNFANDSNAGNLDILDLEDAMNRLEKLSARSAKIVEMRFFAGLTIEEIAAELGISERTAAGEWAFARAWLRRELEK